MNVMIKRCHNTRRFFPKILLLLVCFVACSSNAAWNDGTELVAVSLEDLVMVLPTSETRHALIEATRDARRGVRTFVVSNCSEEAAKALSQKYKLYNETWVHVDDEVRNISIKSYSRRPGDFRAAIAPFLAHQYYKDTYRWMLYGDDDTIFYLHGVLRLVRRMDPAPPIAISDHLWLSQQHPHPKAPRCVPCEFEGDLPPIGTIRKKATDPDFIPVRGCPSCSIDLSCAHTVAMGYECKPSAAHGGAGLIFSVGLLKSLPLYRIRRCYDLHRGAAGGDGLLSRCLHHYNISFTEPGYAIQDWLASAHGTAAGNGSEPTKPFLLPHHIVFDNRHLRELLLAPSERLILGRCNAQCRWLLRHAVTLHIGARFFPSLKHAAGAIYIAASSHRLAIEFLEMTKEGA